MKMGGKNLSLLGIMLLILIFLGWRNYPVKGSATLSWNANSEADLAGYKIYYGLALRTGDCPPGGYAKNIDAGKNTNYILGNLEPGRTYYFSITSYNSARKESCFSEEMQKTINHPAWEWLKKLFR